MAVDSNISIARKGEELVKQYLESLGFTVQYAPKKRNIHWDLVAIDKITGNEIKIEVKTTRKEYFALVDFSDSQLITNESKTKVLSIKADELWIVTSIKTSKPILYKMTKEKFEEMAKKHPEKITPLYGWRIHKKTAEEYAESINLK